MRLLAALLVLLCSARAPEFSPSLYVEDLHQLLSEMSSLYANLVWVANRRRVDLLSLKSNTEQRLRGARSVEEAHQAFKRFVDRLGDGHIEIDWPAPPSAKPGKGKPDISQFSFCDLMGYSGRDDNTGIDWS